MSNFKGTKGRWYVVEYTHFIDIQDGKYYGDDNILNCDDVGEIEARANALLISKAPEMLEMLERVLSGIHQMSFDQLESMVNELETLIKEATEI